MTERFKLAANVLLKRRLNNLIRIDDNTEIDRDFITCAEYQLFIDEMRQQGKNRQPDHWMTEKFPTGEAKQPITGVRAEDAEEFCQWLTQRESVAVFNYRLPSLIEAQESSASKKDIGCWSKEQNTYAISEIADEQWQIWQDKLTQLLIIRDSFYLNRDLNFYLNRDLNLNFYFDLNRDLNRNLNFYLNRDLSLNLYQDFYRDLNLNLYRDFYRDLNLNRDFYRDLNLNRDFYQNLNLNRDLYRNLNRNLNRDLYLNRDSYLYRNLNLNLYRNLNRDLNLYRDLYFYLYKDLYQEIVERKASNLLLIYFPLIFVIIFYQLIKTSHVKIAANRKVQKKINLSTQECTNRSREYARKKEQIYALFIYLVLIDERIKGNMPVWEGIRIVRERS